MAESPETTLPVFFAGQLKIKRKKKRKSAADVRSGYTVSPVFRKTILGSGYAGLTNKTLLLMAASFLAVKFMHGNKKVSRTFNNKISRAGHPDTGNLLEIRAILFNLEHLIKLLHY
jgi:hypothetical protein